MINDQEQFTEETEDQTSDEVITEISQATEDASEEFESEARTSGWVPKERFRGDPDDWVDAKTFVKRGREINPILRKNNERLQAELKKSNDKLQELDLTVREFRDEFSKMKENAYKRAIADLKTQRREAMKDGDFDTVDSIEEQIDEFKSKAVEPVKTAPTPPPAPNLAAYNEWLSDNSWYNEKENPELFDQAEVIGFRVRREHPDLTDRDFLDEVASRVKKKFPDHFSNKRREKGSAVASGSRRGETTGNSKTYSAMPADAREACDRYVKEGLMTREQYTNEFFGE